MQYDPGPKVRTRPTRVFSTMYRPRLTTNCTGDQSDPLWGTRLCGTALGLQMSSAA